MRTARVGDVLRLQRRAVEVQPLLTYEEVGVRSFGRGIFHKEPVSGIDLGKKRVFEIHPGDLVLSNVFAWEGAIALAGQSERGKIGSHRFMTYIADPEMADESYLRYFFISEAGLALIGQASPGSAGRNRTLAIDRFEALTIPLPRVAEQRRIAATLDQVSDALTKLRTLAGRSLQLSNALAPALALRVDLTAEVKLRRGWRKVELSEVIEPTRDEVVVEPHQTYVPLGLLSWGRGPFSRPPIGGGDTKYRVFNRVHAGNLVLSRLNGWEGAIAVLDEQFEDCVVSQEYPTFSVNRSVVNLEYLSALVRSPDLWTDLLSGTRGSMLRRKRVGAEHLMRTEVWLPPVGEQEQIASSVRALRLASTCHASRDSIFDAIVPSALNQAFAGQV